MSEMRKRITVLTIYALVVLAQSSAIAVSVKSISVGFIIGTVIGSVALLAAETVLYMEKTRVLDKLLETSLPSEILEPTREMTDEEFHQFTKRWNAVRDDLQTGDGKS